MHAGLMIYGKLETVSGGFLYDRKLVECLRNNGDRVSIISLPFRNYAYHLGDNFLFSLRRKLDRLQLDVLLQDELNHPSLLLLNRWLRPRVNYPIISIIHHLRCCEPRLQWQNTFYRWMERSYLTSVDGFVFNSQTTRKTVQDLVKEEVSGIVAYPAAKRLESEVTEEEIMARANRPGPLNLLFLGSIIPRKGLHVLLEALEQMPEQDWSLVVIGNLGVDKGYSRRVRNRVLQRGLASRVNFMDAVSDAVVVEKLKDSHVMVIPSFYEGFGIAYLEGMGFGLPAIATEAGAAREVITHGRNGFLIPAGDSAALAGYLNELIHDRAKLFRMSCEATERCRSHPTWEITTGRIRNFIHSAVRKADR